MLIIPIENKLDWRNPPVVTFFLIAINVLIFFAYQSDDAQRWENAVETYVDSGLLKKELKHFRGYWQVEAKAQGYDDLDFDSEEFDPAYLASWILSERKFEDYLRQHWDELDNEWHQARQEAESLRNNISSYAFGLSPADIKIGHFFSSMFMHGDIGHLFGNMLFLFIFGFS